MKFFFMVLLGMIMVVGVILLARAGGNPNNLVANPAASPTPDQQPVQTLAPDQQPKISLAFKSDGHYVTVKITNLHASVLEYNLIYDATVKGKSLNTGVNASAKTEGQSTYSKEQLLGSESSGKFTYHENIQNAFLELTLRDASNRSVFTATYPFAVTAGKSLDLTPQP